MSDFRKLDVWRAAHRITCLTYRLTMQLPKCEMFGLIGQMRRAAVSIEVNLAEGCDRSARDFSRFITIAIGSADELQCLLRVAVDVGYLKDDSLADEIQALTKRMSRLRKAVLSRSSAG